jgi:hypothetical protein
MMMTPSDVLSHIMLLRGEDSKAKAILQLATFYNIPAHRCLMLDDTPDVLVDVGNHGIHPISLTCFHNEMIDLALLDNDDYVAKNLALTKDRLTIKLKALVNTQLPLQPSPIHLQPIVMEQHLSELLTRLELEDPHTCESDSDPLSLKVISMISAYSTDAMTHHLPFQDVPSASELLSTSPTLKNA